MSKRTAFSRADAEMMQSRLAKHTKQETPIYKTEGIMSLFAAVQAREKPKMNKTEGAFANILTSRMNRGEISGWEFEAVKLPIGKKCTYSPDFTICEKNATVTIEELKYVSERTALELAFCNRADSIFTRLTEKTGITFAEIKGKHVWDDAKVKYKAAKEKYPWAKFEMWHRKAGEWMQIL